MRLVVTLYLALDELLEENGDSLHELERAESFQLVRSWEIVADYVEGVDVDERVLESPKKGHQESLPVVTGLQDRVDGRASHHYHYQDVEYDGSTRAEFVNELSHEETTRYFTDTKGNECPQCQ